MLWICLMELDQSIKVILSYSILFGCFNGKNEKYSRHVFPPQGCCSPSQPPFSCKMSKSFNRNLVRIPSSTSPYHYKIHEIAGFILQWHYLISSPPSLHLKTCNERKLINPVVTRGMTISMGIKNPGNTGFTSKKKKPTICHLSKNQDQPIFTCRST